MTLESLDREPREVVRRRNRWEETIRHELLRNFFHKKGLKHHPGFGIEMPEFRNPRPGQRKNFPVRPDIVVEHETHYEVIECKYSNHPTAHLAVAFGQVLGYRELMAKCNAYPASPKAVKLGLCFVDGYYSTDNGIWTSAHQDLVTLFSRSCAEDIALYLVYPKESEYAAESHWLDLGKHDIRHLTS